MEEDIRILAEVRDDVPVEDSQQVQMPASVFVKQEPLSELESPLQENGKIRTKTEHGKFLDVEVIKEEFDIEMSESTFDATKPNQASEDVNDATALGTEREVEATNQNKDEIGPDLQNPKRSEMQQNNSSYINSLKATNPEMEKNPALIVDRLVSTIRIVKSSKLPLDYFTEVYDENNVLKYKCVKCNTLTNSLSSVGKHYQEHHGSPNLICNACGADFTRKLYKHEKRCSLSNAPLVLESRGRFFDCEEIRVKKSKKPTSDEKFICDICGREFNEKRLFILHLRRHELNRLRDCRVCRRLAKARSALAHHHSRGHQQLPVFCACPVCHKRFTKICNVKEHMRQKHGLTLITRKMFYNLFPKMKNFNSYIKEGVVLNSDIAHLHSQLPNEVNTNSQETLSGPKIPNKFDDAKVHKEKKDIQSEKDDYGIIIIKKDGNEFQQFKQNSEHIGSEQDVNTTIVNEENVVMMNECLQFIQNSEGIASEQDVNTTIVIEEENVVQMNEYLQFIQNSEGIASEQDVNTIIVIEEENVVQMNEYLQFIQNSEHIGSEQKANEIDENKAMMDTFLQFIQNSGDIGSEQEVNEIKKMWS